MFEIFYNLFGYNKKLFYLINQYTNISILPDIMYIISNIFFIANFAIGYIVTCIYYCYKINYAFDDTIQYSKKIQNQYTQIIKNSKKHFANKKFNPHKIIYFFQIYYQLVHIGICYAIFGCSFALLKFSVNLPRPFCSLIQNEFYTIIDTSAERCLSSFPSAHTGLSILVIYAIWPYIGRLSKSLMCSLVILVAISRITLAMHYPADTIYSIIITLILIIFGRIIFNLLKNSVITYCGIEIFSLLRKIKIS